MFVYSYVCVCRCAYKRKYLYQDVYFVELHGLNSFTDLFCKVVFVSIKHTVHV